MFGGRFNIKRTRSFGSGIGLTKVAEREKASGWLSKAVFDFPFTRAMLPESAYRELDPTSWQPYLIP